MEQWNQMAFLLLNAKLDASAADIEFTKFIAEDLISVIPFILLITALRGVWRAGRVAYLPLVGASMAALLGFNQRLHQLGLVSSKTA